MLFSDNHHSVWTGAGSGKTKTLAHRVAHLVVNGIDPHRILLLTFSRRAALDMTGRVKRSLSELLASCEVLMNGLDHY